MDLRALHVKAEIFLPSRENWIEQGWLETDQNSILLSPLLNAAEGENGEIRFLLPKELELNHITKDLVLPVLIEKNDLNGLLLRVGTVESNQQKKWQDLLVHLQELLGILLRVHPRFTIPELA